MSGRSFPRARHASLVAACLLVAGCAQGTVPSSSPAPAAVASLTPVATGPSASPIPEPTPTPIAILDGEPWIVYSWPRVGGDGKWAIYLMRPDGSDAHEIAAAVPGEHRAPAWSADGTQLAFVVKDDAHPEGWVWTSRADGSDAEPLTAGAAECPIGTYHPAWSPDGTKLAVVCYPDGYDHESVAVVDPAAGSVVRVADFTHPDAVDSAPTWSPDGRAIAFEILHYDPTNTDLVSSVIATVPAAGGTIDRITKPDRFMVHPDWRPDGSEIVMSNVGPAAMAGNIYAVKPDGSGLRQVTRSSVDGHMRIGAPRWTPDGSTILVSITYTTGPNYEFGGEVRLASVDASGGEPVLLSTRAGKYPDLRPTP